MQQLQKLNTLVFLVPTAFSNVDNDIIKSKNMDENDIKKQSKKQSIVFIEWLSKFFNSNWTYRKSFIHKNTPYLHELSYKGEGEEEVGEDIRYLCVFYKKGSLCDSLKDMNKTEKLYRKRVFEEGWKLAQKYKFSEAPGGTHNTKCQFMMKLVPKLNFNYDGTDVIVDIGYGTCRLLLALAAMLGTKVYGTDIEESVFIHTKSICDNLPNNLDSPNRI